MLKGLAVHSIDARVSRGDQIILLTLQKFRKVKSYTACTHHRSIPSACIQMVLGTASNNLMPCSSASRIQFIHAYNMPHCNCRAATIHLDVCFDIGVQMPKLVVSSSPPRYLRDRPDAMLAGGKAVIQMYKYSPALVEFPIVPLISLCALLELPPDRGGRLSSEA